MHAHRILIGAAALLFAAPASAENWVTLPIEDKDGEVAIDRASLRAEGTGTQFRMRIVLEGNAGVVLVDGLADCAAKTVETRRITAMKADIVVGEQSFAPGESVGTLDDAEGRAIAAVVCA